MPLSSLSVLVAASLVTSYTEEFVLFSPQHHSDVNFSSWTETRHRKVNIGTSGNFSSFLNLWTNWYVILLVYEHWLYIFDPCTVGPSFACTWCAWQSVWFVVCILSRWLTRFECTCFECTRVKQNNPHVPCYILTAIVAKLPSPSINSYSAWNFYHLFFKTRQCSRITTLLCGSW